MICTSITENNAAILKRAEKFSDLIEIRIDLIGKGWEKLAKTCRLPWIACDRKKEIDIENVCGLGASMVDIDMGESRMANEIKSKGMKCIISHHNYTSTPPLNELKMVCRKQTSLGADVCKIVTTAKKFSDNATVLQLIKEFKSRRIVAFCMGANGTVGRILCPLVGGAFTYASAKRGKESAHGQIPAEELYEIYKMIRVVD